MKRDMPVRILLAGALVASNGCMMAGNRMALPEGTRMSSQGAGSRTDADRLRADGNFGLAIEAYRRLLAANPEDAAALEGLALSYDRLQRYDLSDTYFQQALALAPRNQDYYLAYAASLKAQGRNDEADLVAVDMRAITAPDTTPAPPPVVAISAPVPVQPPAPVLPDGPRLERISSGEVRLVLPDPIRSAPVPAPAPASAKAVPAAALPAAPAAAPPTTTTALRPTSIVNAVNRKGTAGRIQSWLARKGWTGIERGDSSQRLSNSRIIYPAAGADTAQRLARAVPFRTRLYASSRANRVQLLVGENALPFAAGLDKRKRR